MLPPELVRHFCTDKRLGDCAQISNDPRLSWVHIFFSYNIFLYIYFFPIKKKTIDSTRDWLVTWGWLGLEVDSCNATTPILQRTVAWIHWSNYFEVTFLFEDGDCSCKIVSWMFRTWKGNLRPGVYAAVCNRTVIEERQRFFEWSEKPSVASNCTVVT